MKKLALMTILAMATLFVVSVSGVSAQNSVDINPINNVCVEPGSTKTVELTGTGLENATVSLNNPGANRENPGLLQRIIDIIKGILYEPVYWVNISGTTVTISPPNFITKGSWEDIYVSAYVGGTVDTETFSINIGTPNTEYPDSCVVTTLDTIDDFCIMPGERRIIEVTGTAVENSEMTLFDPFIEEEFENFPNQGPEPLPWATLSGTNITINPPADTEPQYLLLQLNVFEMVHSGSAYFHVENFVVTVGDPNSNSCDSNEGVTSLDRQLLDYIGEFCIEPGTTKTLEVMGTWLNKNVLEDTEFEKTELEDNGPEDTELKDTVLEINELLLNGAFIYSTGRGGNISWASSSGSTITLTPPMDTNVLFGELRVSVNVGGLGGRIGYTAARLSLGKPNPENPSECSKANLNSINDICIEAGTTKTIETSGTGLTGVELNITYLYFGSEYLFYSPSWATSSGATITIAPSLTETPGIYILEVRPDTLGAYSAPENVAVTIKAADPDADACGSPDSVTRLTDNLLAPIGAISVCPGVTTRFKLVGEGLAGSEFMIAGVSWVSVSGTTISFSPAREQAGDFEDFFLGVIKGGEGGIADFEYSRLNVRRADECLGNPPPTIDSGQDSDSRPANRFSLLPEDSQ